jgi:hypothetical protein
MWTSLNKSFAPCLRQAGLCGFARKRKILSMDKGIIVLSYCAPLEHRNILLQYFY